MQRERMTTTGDRAEIGALGEQLAADHLQGLGLRIVARGVTRFVLDGDLLAWEPGGDKAFLQVEVKSDPDDPVAIEQRYWSIRMLEASP